MTTDTQPIINAALASADPSPLGEDGRFFSIVVPGSESQSPAIRIVDLEEERNKIRDAPRRKTGTYKVHDADSLVAYVDKHGDGASEIWADTVAFKITGVLNAHLFGNDSVGANARFEDHRVEYGVLFTEAWKRWSAHDGKYLQQADFADHIEERAIDVISPTGAEMLEIAQTFKGTVGVVVESSARLSTGERQFTYHEEIDGKAGKTGKLEIPETFTIALKPFEGADAFRVTARLRYRISQGGLVLGYKLERPEDVIREAFLSVVDKVREGIEGIVPVSTPIFLGSR